MSRYFSFKSMSIKRDKQLKTHFNNHGRFKPEKQNTISISDEDLVIDDEETRNEEVRLAEEALATNMKLIKKQKAKFIRLQKILSRNIILIPLCALFSILSAATIFSSTLTDYYEIITYDLDKLKRNIELENNLTMNQIFTYLEENNKTLNDYLISHTINKRSFDLFTYHANDSTNKLVDYYLNSNQRSKRDFNLRNSNNNIKKLYDDNILGGILISHDLETNQNDLQPQDTLIVTSNQIDHLSSLPIQLKHAYMYDLENFTDYAILYKRNFFSNDSSYVKTNLLYTTHSGIWQQCNYLSDNSRRTLNLARCSFYKTKNLTEVNYQIHIENDHEVYVKDPARDLIRMHNAAACCIIVSYFLLVFSWGTGTAAVITKKVPVTLATGVLKLCICVFLVFLLGIMHRKIISEEKDHDCSDLRVELTIVCSARQLKFGYSLGLAWLAALFTTVSCICWFQITKMQKLLFTNGYY